MVDWRYVDGKSYLPNAEEEQKRCDLNIEVKPNSFPRFGEVVPRVATAR